MISKGPTNLDFGRFFLFGERLWLGGSYRTGVLNYVGEQKQSAK